MAPRGAPGLPRRPPRSAWRAEGHRRAVAQEELGRRAAAPACKSADAGGATAVRRLRSSESSESPGT
eukprot:13268661-Alexandrium_andersonii.AAC.1